MKHSIIVPTGAVSLHKGLSLPATVAIFVLILSGCRSYNPTPIDWQEENARWTTSTGENLPTTLAQAVQCALILNPEINALRLTHLASTKKAAAAGWWEDPELDLDALRIVRGGPHPWITGAGLSFTLPVNGVPGLEKQVAQLYTQADALAITVAERVLMAEVEQLWSLCRQDLRCAALQQEYKTKLEAREKQVRALIAAGELPKAEGDRIVQERVQLDLTCACCGAEAVARYQKLLRLLGVHPTTPITLSLDEAPQWQADFDLTELHDLELVYHPRVLEKLARFAAGEMELRTEIRRQYPDIKLGPLFEHEEGQPRLGLSLGLTLPLWNRNRMGIAEAEGERDTSRFAAVSEWRTLAAEKHQALRLLQVATYKEQRIREVLLPEAQAAADRLEQLFKQGESDVLAILAADEAVFKANEALVAAQTDLTEAWISVRALRTK